MRIILIVFILDLVFVNSFSQTKNFIDQPYIETSAKIDTLITPDRIYLTILINEKDTRDKISVEKLEEKMLTKLGSLGIDIEKQLMLSDFLSNFQNYFLKKKDIVKSKEYTLLIYDAKTAGKVIVGMEEIGISNIRLDKVEYSKIELLRLILRYKAVKKAKLQAEYLVKSLNQKVGLAIHISDNTSTSNIFQINMRKAVQMREVAYFHKKSVEEKSEALEFKKIRIESQVNVKFAID